MKCCLCIIEGGEHSKFGQFGPREAITVYRGSALCARHVISQAIIDGRENVRPAPPQKVKR